MWGTISISIICISVVITVFKIISSLKIVLTDKYATDFNIVKYQEDVRLKIQEPVRPVPINEEVIKEITSIKSQLTALELNKGMSRR